MADDRQSQFIFNVTDNPSQRPKGQHVKRRAQSVIDGKKPCSHCKVVKLVSEFHLRSDRRSGIQAWCKVCVNARADASKEDRATYAKQRYAKNRDAILIKSREYAARSKDKKAASSKRLYEKNKEKLLEYGKQYYIKNRKRYTIMRRQWTLDNPARNLARRSAWRANNRDILAGRSCQYMTARRKATVDWGDTVAIEAIYEMALTLTQQTGVKHNVDHIVPLLNNYVCGLHCEANLQVLTESENKSKGNRYWPDMGALAA